MKKNGKIFIEEENLEQLFFAISQSNWKNILYGLEVLGFFVYEYREAKDEEEKACSFLKLLIEIVCFLKVNKREFNRLLEIENFVGDFSK